MDQELQRLIGELQDKKCPPAVLDRVAQRISRETRPARSLRASVAWAVFIGCLLTAALWQWQNQHEKIIAAERAAAEARANRALVVQQTQEAFGYIGQALLRAAARSENVLSKEAVPPLRNSFETAKDKVTKPI